jgi:hypothetical protein
VLSFLERQPGRWRFFVEQPRLGRGDPVLLYKAGMMNRLFAVPDYEPSIPAIYSQLLLGRLAVLWHGDVSVLPDMRTRPARTVAKLLDLMSVRFYVALDELSAESLQEIEALVRGEHHDLGDAHVFERRSALPRVYAVRKVVLEPDVASAIERATKRRFHPADMAIVVDAEMDRSRFAGLQGQRHGPESGRDSARIVRYESETVEIKAECAERCLLVATDLFYPGWRVAVDGEEDEIHRVNGLFRGVLLDPGSHRVVYRFQPSTFRVGIILCAATLASAAAIVAAGPLRARMRGRRGEHVS